MEDGGMVGGSTCMEGGGVVGGGMVGGGEVGGGMVGGGMVGSGMVGGGIPLNHQIRSLSRIRPQDFHLDAGTAGTIHRGVPPTNPEMPHGRGQSRRPRPPHEQYQARACCSSARIFCCRSNDHLLASTPDCT